MEYEPILREPTRKQRAFCREYAIDHNGTQAAVRAGYSKESASGTASRLLAEPHVQTEIQRLEDDAAERAAITVDDIVDAYRQIAEFDISSIFEWTTDGRLTIRSFEDVPRAALGCIRSIEQKETKDGLPILSVSFYDRTQALNQLGKHLGMFKERVEHDASNALLEGLAKAQELIAKKRERENSEE